MGLIQAIKDALGTSKKTGVVQEINGAMFFNALCSNYENLFAQIRPLVNEMKAVIPYGVGRNGAKLPPARTPELAILQCPNEDMGWAEFIDLCFVTWLTEDELDIHVHFDGKRVAGYSVLPPQCRQRSGGKNVYYISADNTSEFVLGSDEVMVLRFSRSPRNPDRGISPATSVLIWAQIDDLIAQYQRAFFENGAIPATITFIRASTRERYEAKRRQLEQGLRGANNRNKTVYAWRQQLDDGSTGDEIEVKTIQGNNSTLAIKDLMDVVNDRLNKSVGVSNFILGNDSSAKYDNAELSDLQFTKRRVYPALLSFWSQFQHELDRIFSDRGLSGLGYGIQFDLEIQELTDRLKMRAEIAQIEASTAKTKAETTNLKASELITLVSAGVNGAEAAKALGLPSGWTSIGSSLSRPSSTTPTQAIEATLTSDMATAMPQKTKDGFNAVWREGQYFEEAVYNILVRYAKKALNGDPNNSVATMTDEIWEVVKESATVGYIDGTNAIKGLMVDDERVVAEIEKALADDGVVFSDELLRQMREDLQKLLQEYANVVTDAADEDEINGRATLIAEQEVHKAKLMGHFDADKQLAEQYGINLGLKWIARMDAKTCDTCRGMDGKVVPVGDKFPDHLMLDNGKQVVFGHNAHNMNGEITNAHPHCRCRWQEVLL